MRSKGAVTAFGALAAATAAARVPAPPAAPHRLSESLQLQLRDALNTQMDSIGDTMTAAGDAVSAAFAVGGAEGKPWPARAALAASLSTSASHADVSRLLAVIQRISEENALLLQVESCVAGTASCIVV